MDITYMHYLAYIRVRLRGLKQNLSICPICLGDAMGGSTGRRVGNNRPKLITFLCDSGGANRARFPQCPL